MFRALWLSLLIMKMVVSYHAKEELSMWDILKGSNVTNMYPPLYMQPPIAVPALTFFEPVTHDHPPVNILKKLIKTDNKGWKNKYQSSEEFSSSDTETDTDTDTSSDTDTNTDTSNSDSHAYY